MAGAAAALHDELTGPAAAVTRGYYPTGVPVLREAIAARYRAHGVATSAEQILVTVGAMGALHLLACNVFARGGAVLVEQPTYPTALDALRATSARLVPFPVTSAGWDLDRLAELLRRLRPEFGYLIVDFQNPTGALLDLAGRAALVAAAHQAGTLLVVDETNLELGLDDRDPPPPLAAFDEHDRVLSVGSMSKAFWGGLRVGWIRASTTRVAELAATRHRIDLAGPVLDQLVAADLLADAEAHLRTRRRELAVGRDVLSATLRSVPAPVALASAGGGPVPVGAAGRRHLHRDDGHLRPPWPSADQRPPLRTGRGPRPGTVHAAALRAAPRAAARRRAPPGRRARRGVRRAAGGSDVTPPP